MNPGAIRPLPLGPVLELLANRDCSRAAGGGGHCTRPGCMRAVAEATGVHRRLLHRRARAGVTIAQADRIAVGLEVHPSVIWGGAAWNAALDAHDEELERRARRRERSRARTLAAT